ncbi:MAG: hypothetical protein DCC71_04820 [Proteobacteria bacterium]|nr:MAG: hypothetical protein DCC71_04820 [Pseudomonadota bacterium]
MVAVAIVLGGCARPSWMSLPDMPDVDMPSIDLPSFVGGDDDPEPARVSEVEVASAGEVTDFYVRATEFYRRLEGRRFNSVAAFRDAGLREYFQNDQAFTDYYADLADDLARAHFERSVPVSTSVDEFLVDGPGRARVKVRVAGRDGRPLRFWSTAVAREDRWERRDGRWWITPGRP